MNFAAETHVDRSINCSDKFIKTNIFGTANLLNCSLNYIEKKKSQKKFKFLHVSTDEVYGSLGDHGSFNEFSPYNPSSPYSASKASSDHLVRAWYKTYGLPTIITNCSNNYGPYQFPEKLIPLVILNALKGKKLPVYGNGQQIRDWLYVEDHVKALLQVLSKGRVGQTYNIGGNCENTNIQVVEAICDTLDSLIPSKKSHRALISFVEDRPGHDMRYAIDNTKIENELGWTAKEQFDTGLNKTVSWYLQNKNWVDGCNRDEFSKGFLGKH